MSVKLYGAPGSPNVACVMIGLFEKGVDYDLDPVMPAAFKSPEHMAMNPFGRVPVLDDGGFVVYESSAILRYIDRAFAGPALIPAASHEITRMDQILSIVDCDLFKTWSGKIGLERLIAPKYFGRPSDLKAIEDAVPVAQACAEALEALIVAPYLTGETFSLADIRLMPHYAWLRSTPEGDAILAGKDKLAHWFECVSGRQSASQIIQQ